MATGRKSQIIAGLSFVSLLSRHKHPDVTFAAPHILSALASGDEELIATALRAVWAVPDDKMALAHAGLRELAFSPLLDDDKSPMRSLADRLCEIAEPASADLHRRAADALRAPNDAATWLRTLSLLIVLAKGDADSRAAAMDVVLSLDGQAVAVAAGAISSKGWKCIAGTPDDDWNRQELEALVQRFRDVPPDQLLHYYHALSRSESFKDMKPIVRDILAARLSAAKSEAKPDTSEIRKLEELLD